MLFFVRSLSRFPLSLSQSPRRCCLLHARPMLAVLVNLWPVPSGGGARCAAFSLASVALCAVLAVCVASLLGPSLLAALRFFCGLLRGDAVGGAGASLAALPVVLAVSPGLSWAVDLGGLGGWAGAGGGMAKCTKIDLHICILLRCELVKLFLQYWRGCGKIHNRKRL